jgi:hypothetical protein
MKHSPKATSPTPLRRAVGNDDCTDIMALVHWFLDSPPNVRREILERIMYQLASHVELKTLLFRELRKSGPQGQKLVEKVNVMIEKLTS